MTDDKPQDENKLIAERRQKLDALRERGNAFPNDFHRNALAEELHLMYGAHDNETLEEEHVDVTVAGRMMAKRRAAIMASQQQPQQLQIKLTPSRTFSPN